MESLEYDMKILLRCFNLNSRKANPGKFQFMTHGKSLRPKYCLTIWPINVKESGHVELLGITIGKYLSFRKNTENNVGMQITNCILLGV